MVPTRITTAVARAVDRLIDAYRERDKFKAWLASYTQRAQDVEHAAWDVIEGRLIDNAIGVQLETLARLVNEPFRYDDVTEQRLAIKARGLIHASQGLFTDLYQLGLLVLRAGAVPAAFHFDTYSTLIYIVADEVLTNDPNRSAIYFSEARSAGVRSLVLYPTVPIAECFTFGYTLTEDPDTGFAWTDQTTGGKFTAVAAE